VKTFNNKVYTDLRRLAVVFEILDESIDDDEFGGLCALHFFDKLESLLMVVRARDYYHWGEITLDTPYRTMERKPPQLGPSPHSRYALCRPDGK
jgi:hypothetical protein